LRALRDAKAADPELTRLWDELEAWRREGQGRFVTLLAESGALRPGLSADRATDVLWTLTSLAVHDLLVRDRGWSSADYQAWLEQSLAFALLDHGS
jgi:hypothetical protein